MKISFAMVYNSSLTVGILLVGVGVWQFSHGGALIVAGCQILALTIYGAERLMRSRAAGDR